MAVGGLLSGMMPGTWFSRAIHKIYEIALLLGTNKVL